jgi:zinc protease
MTAPRKDQAVIDTWKQNTAEQLQNQLRVPEVQYSIESAKVLYKNNPRRIPPKPEDITKIDPDKALAFYKSRFGDATDFTFVIVGAVDLAKLKPLVETYLASLPAKGRKETEKDLKIRRVTGVVKKSWQYGTEPKARVQLLQHGEQKWTRDNDRDMFILSQALSMKLRETLREDLGGVYGVGAYGSITRKPHEERQFTISFGCDPARVDELIAAANKEIAAMQKDGTDQEHIDKIKAQFTRERETQLRNNGFWSGWLESSYRFGDDPTIVLDPNPMLARMTNDNIKAAAKLYLNGKNVYQSVMLPTKEAAAKPAEAPKDQKGNPAPAPAPKK